MSEAAKILEKLGLSSEVSIVSAHRTPMQWWSMHKVPDYGVSKSLLPVLEGQHICQDGNSLTGLPVIGVPIKSKNSLDGWDSVLSILQMPGGVPVATVALDGAKNAGILAAEL